MGLCRSLSLSSAAVRPQLNIYRTRTPHGQITHGDRFFLARLEFLFAMTVLIYTWCWYLHAMLTDGGLHRFVLPCHVFLFLPGLCTRWIFRSPEQGGGGPCEPRLQDLFFPTKLSKLLHLHTSVRIGFTASWEGAIYDPYFSCPLTWSSSRMQQSRRKPTLSVNMDRTREEEDSRSFMVRPSWNNLPS